MAKKLFKNNNNFFKQGSAIFCVDDTAPARLVDLDPANLDNSSYLNNASMPTWHDTQGNYDATQGTVASQPIYLTNVLNGQPVVRFNSKKMNWNVGGVGSKDMILVFRHNSGLSTLGQAFFEATPFTQSSYSGLGGRGRTNIFSIADANAFANTSGTNAQNRVFIGTDFKTNQLNITKTTDFRIVTVRFNGLNYTVSAIGKLALIDAEMDVDFARIILFERRLTEVELLTEVNALKTLYNL